MDIKNKGDYSITGIIELDTLQKMLDYIAKMLGITVIVTDENGNPITKCKYNHEYCHLTAKGNTLGSKLCAQCRKFGMTNAMQKGGVAVYYCHAGVMECSAPIICDGKIFGSVLVIQIVTEKPDEEFIRSNARELSLDEEAFEDREIAIAFNNMLRGIVESNNHFLMRINDAQIRIADNTSVKNLIEQVKMQKEPLDTMKMANEYLQSNTQQNETKQIELIAMAKQTDSTLKPLLAQVKAGMEALEGDRTEEARQVFERLSYQLSEVSELMDMLKRICLELYHQETIKGDFFNTFEEGLGSLLASYDELLENCFLNGSRLYRISRDIDNARNDMYRKNNTVSMIDCTKIFAVDHITLTWRLYNNIIEYEHLKITQLNNPDRCKFGLWCAGMEHSLIRESEEFKAAFKAHESLHDHAVACYVASEALETQTAMEEFELARQACSTFTDNLEKLAEFMRRNGFEEETEVWVFK